MRFQKTTEVQAVQWFKLGDHPKDRLGEKLTHPHIRGVVERDAESAFVRPYRTSEKLGIKRDPVCGEAWRDHGFVDHDGEKFVVCPGDWIVEEDRKVYKESPNNFKFRYKPVS